MDEHSTACRGDAQALTPSVVPRGTDQRLTVNPWQTLRALSSDPSPTVVREVAIG